MTWQHCESGDALSSATSMARLSTVLPSRVRRKATANDDRPTTPTLIGPLAGSGCGHSAYWRTRSKTAAFSSSSGSGAALAQAMVPRSTRPATRAGIAEIIAFSDHRFLSESLRPLENKGPAQRYGHERRLGVRLQH